MSASCARACSPAGSRKTCWRSIAPARDWLPLGIQRGTARQGGLEFAWREEVIATPNPAFRRVDVLVFATAEESHSLAHLTGFIVNPPGSVR